jgi:hypothetical protein
MVRKLFSELERNGANTKPILNSLKTMESVNNIELSDKSVYPDETVLKGVLGRSYPSYCALLELFNRNEMHYEWRYYMDGKAWLCKVQKKKRTIVWMSAWKGFMKATIYIPEKHLDSVYALPILKETQERIRTTRNVGKSKPCIFEIRNQKALKDFDTVMQFKIQTK